MLDCPISGTGTQAKAKDTVIYASGDRAAYRKAVPMFTQVCRVHHYVGPFGDGMKLKMLANMLVAIHTVAAAEALTLAKASGLNLKRVLELLPYKAPCAEEVLDSILLGSRTSSKAINFSISACSNLLSLARISFLALAIS